MGNVKVAAFLLLFSGILHAQEEVKVFDDLDRLQSGRVFYDAQAAYNKSKLAAQLEPGVMPSVAVALPGVSANGAAPTTQFSTVPSLEKIVGTVATLNFADGSASQVRAGDSIPGGFTVISVSLRGVVIKRSQDGHTFTLN